MTARRYLPLLLLPGPLIGLTMIATIFRLPLWLLAAAGVVAIGETVLIIGLVRRREPGAARRQATAARAYAARMGGSR